MSLFAFLVISLQSSAIAHAAQYGDDPHEHNGFVCAVDAIAADANIVLPAQIYVPIILDTTSEKIAPPSSETTYLKPHGRAPPPRSPPLILL